MWQEETFNIIINNKNNETRNISRTLKINIIHYFKMFATEVYA